MDWCFTSDRRRQQGAGHVLLVPTALMAFWAGRCGGANLVFRFVAAVVALDEEHPNGCWGVFFMGMEMFHVGHDVAPSFL
jgi:hypothetical protein